MADQSQHGVLEAKLSPNGAGTIEFITSTDEETVNAEYASVRRQTDALNKLTGEGWEVIGVTAVMVNEVTVTRYLVRRPAPQPPGQAFGM